MKNRFVVFLAAFWFVFASWADFSAALGAVEPGENPDSVFEEVLTLLDLDRGELGRVKEFYQEGKSEAAFEEYKRILVRKVAGFEPVENFSYWLHAPANADELLEGVLTTKQYGKNMQTTAKIGKPGEVAWYRVPGDGYTTLLRDITTLHWITKLAEKYEKTGEVRYLDAWQGYWSDFVQNWPGAFSRARSNPKIMGLVEKNSILWSEIALYIGWRLETFVQGFNAVCHRAAQDGKLDAIDNQKLAMLLVHLDTFEAAKGIKWIERDGGVPNQRVHCATSMFELGVYLNDFKNSAKWRQLGIMEVQRSGFLPDGTDMEQSLNYNKGLPVTISKFLEMSHNLPGSEKGPWLENLRYMYKYRYYYLHAIAKPNGAQPIIGKNNTWRQYGETEQYMPGLSPADEAKKIKDFSLIPLSKTIKDYVYQKRDTDPPAFNSIYFPYGGYVVIRDGWAPQSLYVFMKTSRPGNGHMREGGNGIELSAYGQNLVVNSGGEPYNPDSKYNGYWHSTLAHNSISVDGYSQDLRHNAEIPVVYKEPIKARFLAGENVVFAEGKFEGAYSGWNFNKHGTMAPQIHKIPHDPVIEDVTHERQILFLKKEKMWIITDIVNSTEEHNFTQSWLLSPEYRPEDVQIGKSSVKTNRSNSVNFCLYQFGIEDLDYSKPYGVFEPDRILGWVGKYVDQEKDIFTPAVNLLARWQGRGKQILITVVVPYRQSSPVKTIKSFETGFEVRQTNGQTVSYRYFPKGNIEAKLSASNCQFVLTRQGGYEVTGDGKKNDVLIPKLFKWENTKDGQVPVYEK